MCWQVLLWIDWFVVVVNFEVDYVVVCIGVVYFGDLFVSFYVLFFIDQVFVVVVIGGQLLVVVFDDDQFVVVDQVGIGVYYYIVGGCFDWLVVGVGDVYVLFGCVIGYVVVDDCVIGWLVLGDVVFYWFDWCWGWCGVVVIVVS